MRFASLSFILVVSGLSLSSCIYRPTRKTAIIPVALASPSPVPASPAAIPTPQPEIEDALATANGADAIRKSAQSDDDWELASLKFQEAIDLLKSIPKSSPDYAKAQQKIREYDRDLRFAKQGKMPSTETAKKLPLKPDWRIFYRDYKFDRYLDIASISKISTAIYEFSMMEKGTIFAETKYSKLKIDCDSSKIEYLSYIKVENGKRTNLSTIMPFRNSNESYIAEPYCTALNSEVSDLPKIYNSALTPTFTFTSPSSGSSRSSGNCLLPDDRDSLGRRCGKRAASER